MKGRLAGLRAALVSDLKPHDDTVLALADRTHPLQPFDPPHLRTPNSEQRIAWIELPGLPDDPNHWDDFTEVCRASGGGERLRSLHFFQVGRHRLHTAASDIMDAALLSTGTALSKEEAFATLQAEADKRARHVRDLVNYINLHPDMLQNNVRTQPGRDLFITAVPNWLCDASCGGCNCPGSPPVPIPPVRVPTKPGYWSFDFSDAVNERINEQRKREDTAKVVIAVLDTSPTDEEVAHAAAKFPNNMLLRKVNDARNAGVTIDSPGDGSLPHDVFSCLEGITIDWRQKGEAKTCYIPDEPYKMNDHGLFITGIIHDIAPHAEIHLIRVLSEFGVTHTDLILPILRALPGRLLKEDDQKLIINMSVGWSIPPGAEVLRAWLKKTFPVLEPLLEEYSDLDEALDALEATGDENDVLMIRAILDHLHVPIREMIAFLNRRENKERVLIVAAAGNDYGWFDRSPHHLMRHRPEPRWPARYEKVLSVAAVGLRDQNSAYSNRADIASRHNGVATFGGNAVRKHPWDIGEIETQLDPNGTYGTIAQEGEKDKNVDAVRGIYITDPAMLEGGQNTTGWAYWSGTSFAAPVITGLAANLWAATPGDPPEDIMAAFMNNKHPLYNVARNETSADTLGCPKVYAKQEWK
jgi:hypothetical protein